MRRVFLSALFFFTVSTVSYAAPCYGTRMPQKQAFHTGAQTHVILKRYLENESGKIRSSQHFLLLSYGIADWFSIDLKGGAGNIKQRPVDSSEIDYSSGFAGGYGFRLRLYEEEKLKVVFGFQHISVHPTKTRIGGIKNLAILDDWQASLLASRRLSRLTPYLGIKWSRLDYIHKIEEDRKRRMSDLTKDLGLVAGIDLAINNKSWFNFETHLFDEESFALSLNYSF